MTNQMQMITVAVCQLTPALDVPLRKEQLTSWLARADAAHADFACFAEGFLTGYDGII